MPTWERLGQLVVSRRLELGYRTRQSFAEALGISLRTLGDIETGRRSNYDPATIASLENVLGWETGSALRVAEGGDPALRKKGDDGPASDQGSRRVFLSYSAEDEALIRVMKSDLTDAQKEAIMKMLIAEQDEALRQRMRRAEDLIKLVKGQNS